MRLHNAGSQCTNKLGLRDDDFCFKNKGHVGKCYKSLGLEAEDIIQEILSASGYEVVKGTIHEDHILKVDFWIKCNSDQCPLIDGHGYAPIQFTIDREAAYGLKGQEALRHGTIIVCIVWSELAQWQTAPDESVRKMISQRISDEFMSAVRKVTAAIKYLGLRLQTPSCKMVRFQA